MQLLTKEIKKKLPDLYNQESNPDPNIIVKFFTPDANWTWYATEGSEQEDGDWIFFGLVDGHEKELGNFSLNELKKVRGRFKLPVERDLHFGFEHKMSEFSDLYPMKVEEVESA